MTTSIMFVGTAIELRAGSAVFQDIDVDLTIEISYDDYRVTSWRVIDVMPDKRYFTMPLSHPPAPPVGTEFEYLIELAANQAAEEIEEAVAKYTAGWFLPEPGEREPSPYRDPSVGGARPSPYPIRL